MKKLNKKGFTLVELLVVIVIIGILAAVIVPNVASNIDKANANAALQEGRTAYLDVTTNKLDLSKQTTPETVYVVLNGYVVLIENGAAVEALEDDGKAENAEWNEGSHALTWKGNAVDDDGILVIVVTETNNVVSYTYFVVEVTTNITCATNHEHTNECERTTTVVFEDYDVVDGELKKKA